MKKILSLVLVLCMLMTLCVTFASCSDKLTEKEAKKDTEAVVSDAISKATDEFFTDELDLESLMTKATNGGMLKFSVESDSLLGPITDISETIYMDSNNGKTVSDTLVTLAGEDLTARIILDKKSFMLNSNAILGSDKTLAVNFENFTEKFEGSVLAQMLFPEGTENEAAVSEIMDMIKSYIDTLEKGPEEAAKDAFDAIPTKVDSETIKIGGKDTKCITVAYTINNETLEKAVNDAALKLGAEIPEGEEFTLDDVGDLNLNVKMYIVSKTSKLAKMSVSLAVLSKEDGESVSLSSDVLFSKNEISADIEMVADGVTVEAVAKLTKEEKDGKIIYNFNISGGTDDVSVNFINASLTYNKKDGAFEIAADVFNEGEERIKASVKGTATSGKKDAKIEITSISFADITVDLKIALEIKADADIPATPTDAKDVLTMSEADWMEVMQEFSESKLGALIMGGMMGDAEEDIYIG